MLAAEGLDDSDELVVLELVVEEEEEESVVKVSSVEVEATETVVLRVVREVDVEVEAVEEEESSVPEAEPTLEVSSACPSFTGMDIAYHLRRRHQRR